MKENKTLFQIIVAMIFGVMLIVGFLIFATYKPQSEKEKIIIGDVVVWGTLDERLVNSLLTQIKKKDKRFVNVRYVEKSKSSYTQDILEALAAQKSPDLILLSNNNFLKNRNKIYTIPETKISVRDYYNIFADAFSIYIGKDGVLGVPFIIDPMVMYYNKNLFATNRVVVPPENWEEFEEPNGITSKLRNIDESGNILKSAISFGEAMNVINFKEILYTLFLQYDNNIVKEGKDRYISDKEKFSSSSDVIKFYTQFSNQSNKITYSWNRSLANSEQSFLSENLGVYFGFSSEIKKLRFKNPNLNFDVAEIPGFKRFSRKTVFAKTWVFSIPKASGNKTGALFTALEFASKTSQELLTEKIYLPPVRKDLLKNRHKDLFMDIFFKEAIYSNSIIDPDEKKTNEIFREYISNVNTGLKQPSVATSVLEGELNQILAEYDF